MDNGGQPPEWGGRAIDQAAANVPLHLDGMVIWVTGAASGIGAATARLAAEAGAVVAATDVNAAGLSALEKTLQAALPRPQTWVLDVRDAAAIATTVTEIVKAYGRLDALVACAGVLNLATALETTPAEWDALHHVNLRGAFLCCQAAGREMVPRGRGAIVAVTSQLALAGRARTAAYAASKGGVAALVRVLAVEWAPFGVRVNAVAPGPTDTPMTASGRRDPAHDREILSYIPLGRRGTPEEQARAILFLVSPAASFITGTMLTVDGGYTAH